MPSRRFPFLIALAAIFLASCATMIPVEVTRRPEANLSGLRNLAVLDVNIPSMSDAGLADYNPYQRSILYFFFSNRWRVNRDEIAVASRFYTAIIQSLQESGYLNLYRPDQVFAGRLNSISDLDRIALSADIEGVLVPSIDRLEFQDTSRQVTVARNQRELHFFRAATIEFSYSLIEAESGRIIASRSFSETRTDEKRTPGALTDPDTLYDRIIDAIVPEMARQLAPYQVTEYRALMKGDDDDPRYEEADRLVRDGIYDIALERYLTIYDETGDLAAGFNAAILVEIKGDIDQAIRRLELLLQTYPEREVQDEINRMRRTRSEAEAVSEMMQ